MPELKDIVINTGPLLAIIAAQGNLDLKPHFGKHTRSGRSSCYSIGFE